MGLSIDNIRLLTLTQRKADCEYEISINAMEKMALTREQSQLSSEYYSKLQAKNIAYYANGQYHQMNYGYLMGYGSGTMATLQTNPNSLKSDNRMILTDASGLVVLGSQYVSTMTKVLGSSCMDSRGRGGTFSADKIPALIASIAGSPLTEDNVKQVIDGDKLEYGYNVTTVNTLTGNTTSTGVNHDASEKMTQLVESLVNFFYPIFQAAAANGWTTEYNQDMQANENYISDALVTGSFQLAQVNKSGGYDPDTSLTYFTTTGLVLERTDSSVREEVTAWYNAEKERISEKESWIDIKSQNLSTELEAINTEMETLKSQLEDDMSPFEWCT